MNFLQPRKVVGITGKIGSGKSSLAKELELRISSIETIGIGNLLKEKLISKGLPVTRESLTSLAKDLKRELGPLAIVDMVRQRIEKSNATLIVIDGVRGQNMRTLIQEYEHSLLIAVTANFETRYKRVVLRPEKSEEKSLTLEQFILTDRSEWSEELDLLESQANIRIENDCSYDDFLARVDALARDTLSSGIADRKRG